MDVGYIEADCAEAERLSRIRLIAVDLDGTLLREGGVVSAATMKAVRAAVRSGLHIVMATGRTCQTPVTLSRRFHLNEPIISANGAHVMSGPAGEDWQHIPVPADVWPGLVDMLNSLGACFEVHVKGASLIEERFAAQAKRRPAKSFGEALRRWFSPSRHGRANVVANGTSANLAGRAVKAFVHGPSEVVEKLIRAGEEAFPRRLHYVTTITATRESVLEIQDASVSKGQALFLVAERLGFSMDETAAIGDGDNDVEMLQVAGLGVAMANASPRLTMVADRFTLSCDDDGVAEFLKEVMAARG